MKKSSNNSDNVEEENDYVLNCSDEMLERFLNGFITFKRGPKDGAVPALELNQENVNNLFLKKVKIAFSFASDNA